MNNLEIPLLNWLKSPKGIKGLIAIALTLIVWNLPSSVFGIDGLTTVQQRVIAIFVFATFMWLFEVVSTWVTSVSIIVLMLLTVSDSGLAFLRSDAPHFGTLISHKAIMGSFADPVIMLFLGGFVLAIAATKTGLDAYLARNLIKPFGTNPNTVLLGFLLITGVFSMFVSNTATAAMMLTFLTPVFRSLPPDGKGKIALTLSIPVAANIGGIGTPIGTPPNAIALKFLNDPNGLDLGIGFGQWAALMMPFTILMLFISWFLLKKLFPFKAKTLKVNITGQVQHSWQTKVVAVTFIITVLFWIFDKLTGVNANTVALIPFAVFALSGIIKKKDLEEINWGVIWMVAGGFALGLGLDASGLADAAIRSVPFAQWSPLMLITVSGVICYLLSNFISNTATAALLIPILAAVAKGMGDKLNGIGGTATVLLGIAIAASMAMCLPISTPPNAIADSTGLVKQNEMLKIGLLVGVIGLILGYILLYFAGTMGYFS